MDQLNSLMQQAVAMEAHYDEAQRYHLNKAMEPVCVNVVRLREEKGNYKLSSSERKAMLAYYDSVARTLVFDDDATQEEVNQKREDLQSAKTLKDLTNVFCSDFFLTHHSPEVFSFDCFEFKFPSSFIIIDREIQDGDGMDYTLQYQLPSPSSIYLRIHVYKMEDSFWSNPTWYQLQYLEEEVGLIIEKSVSKRTHKTTPTTDMMGTADPLLAQREFRIEYLDDTMPGKAVSFYYDDYCITAYAFGVDEECLEDLLAVVAPYQE